MDKAPHQDLFPSSTSSRRFRSRQRIRNWLWGYDFFISYHRVSGGIYARNLRAQLQAKGYEVFLDDNEYALGDDWKKIGAVALRNTKRLILVANEQAVFESEAVKHEVLLFTDRSRHIIPIFFGDNFANEKRVSPGKFVILERLPDEIIYINDNIESLHHGPSMEVIEKVESAYTVMRRRKLRQIIVSVTMMLLIASSVFASISWIKALTAQDEAKRQRIIADEQSVIADGQRKETEIQYKSSISRQLAGQAQGVLEQKQPDLSLLLSVEAIKKSRTAEAKSSLISGLYYPNLVSYIRIPDSWVYSLDFSPDGKTLAVGSTGSAGGLTLWDAVTRKLIGELRSTYQDGIISMSFSPDGKVLAAVSRYRISNRIILWDITSRQPIGKPIEAKSTTNNVTFSPDGKAIATTHRDGAVILRDVATQQVIVELHNTHQGSMVEVAFSPNGKILASVDYMGAVRLWDIDSGQPIGGSLKTTHRMNSAAFSPDGKILATGGTITLWDVVTRKPISELHDSNLDSGKIVGFSPDGKILAIVGNWKNNETVVLWDIESRQLISKFPGAHRTSIYSVAFSPDGTTIATGDAEGTIILWDIQNRSLIGDSLISHPETAWGMAFSPDGTILVTAGIDGKIMLWDIRSRKLLRKIDNGHEGFRNIIDFSPNGKVLVAASKTIKLWDAQRWQLLGELEEVHRGLIYGVSFSPDGKILGTAGRDGQLILWDTKTWQPIGGSLTPQDFHAFNVVFSPDSKLVAAAGYEDEAAMLWDVASRQPIGGFLGLPFGTVNDVAFSANSKVLASAHENGSVVLWDTNNGLRLGEPLVGHNQAVFNIDFSSDGKTLVSASEGGTILLWDVESRNPVAYLFKAPESWDSRMSVSSLAFSPDGRLLAFAKRDKTVILYTMDVDLWTRFAGQIANRNFTCSEWKHYMREEKYDATFPNLPIASCEESQ